MRIVFFIKHILNSEYVQRIDQIPVFWHRYTIKFITLTAKQKINLTDITQRIIVKKQKELMGTVRITFD